MLCAIGATSGLGLEALKLLVQQSHATSRIIISARSAATGSAAVQQVTTEKNEVTSLSLDLASFASVRSFAEQLKQSGEAIDVLLLNAAVYKTDLVLKAGWSEEAVVNHFSQHYLLHLLSPLLAPPAPDGTLPRIIFVSSALQNSVKSLATVRPTLRGEQGTSVQRYSSSKLVQMIAAMGWKAALRGRADVVAVSPGFVPTSGLNRESPFLQRVFLRYILSWAPFCTSLHDGAASILRLLSPSLDVQQLIAESREKEEVLYLGVKGEVRQPSSLIALREGAEAEQQRREWIPTVDELERWEERSKG